MTNTAKKQRLERVKKYAAEVALWLVKDLEDALAQPDLVKAAKAREAVGLHKGLSNLKSNIKYSA